MSYHTFFKLDIDPFDEEVYDEAVNYSAESKYALSNDKACEWDDHEKLLKYLSKKRPKHLYILQADGESNGDMWIKYFKGGKMQFAPAEIIFPEFDGRKLK